MIILIDIGGTYIRFSRVKDGIPSNAQKFKASDFGSLSDALAKYCPDETGDLLIAAAGANVNGTWTITNNPDWSMDAADWNVKLILNDFEATAYALPFLKGNELSTLKTGNTSNAHLCVIGVGTGLGLAFNRERNVQKTHGGHIPIASLNDDHGKMIKDIRKHQSRAIVFEDIVSGPGLQKLRELYDEKTALKLFHECLGIFAATSLVTANTYGGLYLTGGVIEGLVKEDKFDFETFNAALCFDAVPCVKNDISNTPIHIIADPYPALKGLIHAKSLSDN